MGQDSQFISGVVRDAKAQDLHLRLNCNLPSIRISLQEKEEWTELANQQGMKLSEYVRMVARIGISVIK